MADKQFSEFTTITPKDNMILHVIDEDDGRDRKIEADSHADYIIDKIPDPPDINDYDSYTHTNVPNTANVPFQRTDTEEYGKISIAELKKVMLGFMRPVGSLYFNFENSLNPSTLFGYGTWVLHAQGRMLIGVGTGTDDNANNLLVSQGDSFGEYTVTLEEDEIPKHTHPANITPNPHRHALQGNAGGSGYSTTNDGPGSAGNTLYTSLTANVFEQSLGDQPHNNMQPCSAVYIWRRTA